MTKSLWVVLREPVPPSLGDCWQVDGSSWAVAVTCESVSKIRSVCVCDEVLSSDNTGRRGDNRWFLTICGPRKICLSMHGACSAALMATTWKFCNSHGLISRTRYSPILRQSDLTGLCEWDTPFNLDLLNFFLKYPLRAFLPGSGVGTCAVAAFSLSMAVTGIVANLTTIGTSSVAFACSTAMAKPLAFEATLWVWNTCSNKNRIANFEKFGCCWNVECNEKSIGIASAARVSADRNVVNVFTDWLLSSEHISSLLHLRNSLHLCWYSWFYVGRPGYWV